MTEPGSEAAAAEKLLAAVFKETQGDPGRTVDMWALGQTLGLDRARTEDLALNLLSQGLLEIKSLSGGMALTEAGLEKARVAAAEPEPEAEALDLEGLADRVEAALGELGLKERSRRDLELDLRVLRAQAERSRPVPGVVEAILRAVQERLEATSSPAAKPLLTSLARLLEGE